MITNTTTDLEDHLQEIDNRLQTLQGARVSDEEAAEREQIVEERDSTKQCLAICAQVSKHLDQLRPNAFEDVSAVQDSHQKIVATLRGLTPAKRVTTNFFKECKEMLTHTISELEENLRKIDNKLQNHSLQGAGMSDEVAAERERVQEESESIKQCLSICAQASEQAAEARINIFEDVSSAQEANQVVVATLGDLISARRVNAGVRATQLLGQMSDASLQQLSRDRVMADRTATEKAMEQQSEIVAKFQEQYGTGHKLSWAAIGPTSSI
jgi:hypothetical protein